MWLKIVTVADLSKAISVKNYRVRVDLWAKEFETYRESPRTELCLPGLSWPLSEWALRLVSGGCLSLNRTWNPFLLAGPLS